MGLLLDKRLIMRDMRAAKLGASRRIRLRMRASTPTAASTDPLANAAENPNDDTLVYTTGQFTVMKTSQVYQMTGATTDQMGVVYFPVYMKSEITQAYAMEIGGTEKTWLKVSTVDFDDIRVALKVVVKAVQ